MLFEKVPGLYGSGIIPNRFEEFKESIQKLIMSQFFTPNNIERFFNEAGMISGDSLNLSTIIQETDLNIVYSKLIVAINESQLAPMLQMMGGEKALEPMKPKIIVKMKEALEELAEDPKMKAAIEQKIKKALGAEEITNQIENIVVKRLNELTPAMVKEIIQEMIREHLGWLVVWGGVFGGLIGSISYVTTL